MAAALRDGASNPEAARAAGVSVSSVDRLKRDPAFRALVEQRMLVHAGPAPEHHAVGGATDLLAGEASRAWISIPDREVIGSVLHPLASPEITDNRDPDTRRPGVFTAEVAASVVQVALVKSRRRAAKIYETLQDGRSPSDAASDRVVSLTYSGLLHIQRSPEDVAFLIRAATDFRTFLGRWHFADLESGQTRTLGAELWPGQETFVSEIKRHDWVFALKARKLGFTTLACAYDAWVARFAPGSSRVHLFSRRDDAAVELLEQVTFGLERLPEHLHLPLVRTTTHLREYAAGPNARRLIKCYPASEETAVESSCLHGHVDELARMGNPEKIWQAVEPTMAGTCHIVTTGLGPTNWASELYRRSESGDTKLTPVFVPATARPGRDAAWLAAKQKELGRAHMKQEYPSTVADALAGSGKPLFSAEDIDEATRYCRGLGPAQPDHRYVTAVDLGVTDATVIITLDCTESPMHDVVAYFRATGLTYPQIQREIRARHAAYKGVLAVESNAMGASVIQNLEIPAHEIQSWNTNASSKARIIQGVAVALENQHIKIPAECEQLLRELRGYQIPDTNVVQDSVVALAIAIEHAHVAHQSLGRLLPIFYV